MQEEIFQLSEHQCHLVLGNQAPRVLVVKPLGPFEWRCLMQECQLLQSLIRVPFAMCAFDMESLDSFRQPDFSTLQFLTSELVPALRDRFGDIPMVLGGYSLGGLFALWCVSQTSLFQAVAACSPSLWAEWWDDHAQNCPPRVRYAYLSLGLTEERTSKQPYCRMGDALRLQHQRHLVQFGPDNCALQWHPGGHFNQIEQRKAQGFAWCINHLISCN